jgi:hypothetical protein
VAVAQTDGTTEPQPARTCRCPRSLMPMSGRSLGAELCGECIASRCRERRRGAARWGAAEGKRRLSVAYSAVRRTPFCPSRKRHLCDTASSGGCYGRPTTGIRRWSRTAGSCAAACSSCGEATCPPARLASIPAAPLLGERARQDLPEHLDAAQDPFLVDVPETENQGRRHVRLACPRGIDPVARQAVYADGAAQC